MSNLRKDRKEARQAAAKERQTQHDKLTTQEKLAKLATRGVTSGREFDKLQARLQQEAK